MDMELKISGRNNHALYNLQYHLILVTKYRKKCITSDIFSLIEQQTRKVVELNGGEIEEMNYEPDHVHILLSLPPQATISQVINSIKTTTSRLARKQYEEYLKKYYWKPVFWSRSYLILSTGGATIEIIRKYIQEQGTEEHHKKKRKHP